MNEFKNILSAVDRGEEASDTRLLPMVYDELRTLAASKLARERHTQTLQPTALVHEAWLRLIGSQQHQWQNRSHFFGAAAEAMRRILIERARRRGRLKHGAGKEHVDLGEVEIPADSPEVGVLAVNEALEKLEKEDSEKARVVLLKFFGGLTNAEVAETLGQSERTVERAWAFSKVWLMREIQKGQ
jgi:RNA polymerase sigma factor (TIGR02999 family)